MQLHLASWLVILGMAIAGTACSSMGSSSGARTVDNSTHHRLTRQPAMVVIVEGERRLTPSEYSPTESVKQTILDLLAILGNETLQQPGQSQERRQQIERVIRYRVNYGKMAQRSLGAPWTRLNEPERQEFSNLFVELLRDSVANKIDQYYDEQVFYLFEQREGNFAEVKTNLIGPKVDTSLDFRLENHSGTWLVYDVVVDSASIVGNYRTQFARIIRDNSYPELVERMKQRALTAKWFEKTAPALVLLPTPAPDSR